MSGRRPCPNSLPEGERRDERRGMNDERSKVRDRNTRSSQPANCRKNKWPEDRYLLASCPCPGFILASSWLHPGFILASSWLHPGFILASSWLHPGFILASSWLHPVRVLLPLAGEKARKNKAIRRDSKREKNRRTIDRKMSNRNMGCRTRRFVSLAQSSRLIAHCWAPSAWPMCASLANRGVFGRPIALAASCWLATV